MNEIILYKSRLKALRLIALSSIFVLPGCYFIYTGKTNLPDIASIVFCSLGYIVGFFQLLDKRPQIIINSKGSWDRTLKLDIILWHSILDAYILVIHKQAFICLVTNDKITNTKKTYQWVQAFNEEIGAQKINLSLSAVKADPKVITSLILQLINEPQEGRNSLINKFKIA